MTVEITPRDNLSSGASGGIEIIDGVEVPGLGSGGFGDDDFNYFGDELDNFIQGDFGNDELEGNEGNDILKGGLGNDIVDGDSGDDDLDGQEGTDKLFGGPGNDILRAGHGHDQLYGDPDPQFGGIPGNDVFGFYALGFYRVHDFRPGEDKIFFDAEKTGIDSLEVLLGLISRVDDKGDDGFKILFGDPDNPVTWIDFVGVNVNQITADMIIFHV